MCTGKVSSTMLEAMSNSYPKIGVEKPHMLTLLGYHITKARTWTQPLI